MTNRRPGDDILARLYGPDAGAIARQQGRWDRLAGQFHDRFGTKEARWFSAPGRTEIGGNHTDHNHGKVLAAGIDLDSIAVAAACEERQITVYSDGYPQPFVVALDRLPAVAAERGTTAALIRGITARFHDLGHVIGGFCACVSSDVPVGSGLSSSASIEVLIATILNRLYNAGQVSPEEIAIIGQYAENEFFGKPCGLMDQIACAVGGIVRIDFEVPRAPRVEKIEFDFSGAGYGLLVVDTGGSHADLTEDYAAIPREMKSVAAVLGRRVCREVSEEEILGRIAEIRQATGDRAILRALHFVRENRRVDLQVEALRRNDMTGFLHLVAESGDSSYRWLQNCYSTHSAEQGIALALALAEAFVRKSGGACRVHGGGFAGTILVLLPHAHTQEFGKLMESAFGHGCVRTLRVRPLGSLELR